MARLSIPPSAPSYIERLRVGDHVYVTTPWAVLDYQVTSFEVVTPDNTESVGVQRGRDMVTLLTCHPHPQHTYRLLACCDRVGTMPAGVPAEAEGTAVPAAPDEVTAAGMDLLDFQDAATHAVLVGGGVLVVVLVSRIARRIRKA